MNNSTAYQQVEIDYHRDQLRRSWRPLRTSRWTRNQLNDSATDAA
ncbi:hypothetical protein [Marmoricola sp. RAF53]